VVVATKIAVNRLLNVLGIQVVRSQTLKELTARSKELAVEPALDNGSFGRNAAAHSFRASLQEGVQTETVPSSYLATLQRESLALRDISGELARLKRELEIARAGQTTKTKGDDEVLYTPIFDYDGLRNDPGIIHNHDFMRNPRFVRAYKRAVAGAGIDQKYYWRAHVAIWCASVGRALEGDFVECGVWKGLLSTTIMSYFDWSNIGKTFYLFDTFRGVDESQLAEDEIQKGTIAHFREMYKEDLYEGVVANFSEFKNVKIVRGSVPETLAQENIEKVSYLSIDMNNSTPEIAAANHFWDRLSPGAPILLDDYGFVNYEVQKKAFDAWAARHGVHILALPTGQGLMIKPPATSREP
jgi:Macrocin-O-methyltransferase (TylF)